MHFSKRDASTASRTALTLITGRVPGVAQSNRETVVFGGAKHPAAPCSELELQIDGVSKQICAKKDAYRAKSLVDASSCA